MSLRGKRGEGWPAVHHCRKLKTNEELPGRSKTGIWTLEWVEMKCHSGQKVKQAGRPSSSEDVKVSPDERPDVAGKDLRAVVTWRSWNDTGMTQEKRKEGNAAPRTAQHSEAITSSLSLKAGGNCPSEGTAGK